MTFDDTPEQMLLRDTVRSFVSAECGREVIRTFERERRFPRALWTKVSELGLLALALPADLGGEDGGAYEQAIVTEELARGSVALAVAYVNTACLAAPVMSVLAAPLRSELLSRLTAGELLATFAWTEPSAGSDVLAMRTTARPTRDGHYVLNGSKTFITLATEADELLTVVRTGAAAERRSDGLSAFVVPAGANGLTIRPLAKVGQRSAPFAEVFFEDVVVAPERRLADEGDAWRQLVPYLKAERALFAAVCLGLARQAFSDALEYSQAREAFGRKIGSFQAIQHRIADMKTGIDAAELLVYRAAWLASTGRDAATEATEALMVAAIAANDVADAGMQIMGGASYTEEFDMERYWRDARAFRLAPVTTEIAKNVIARSVGLPRSY